MIALDPILQAAQDGDSHQPIISLVSKSFADSIPFEGTAFDALQTSDVQPDMIAHSSGAMACVAGRGDDLVLLVTDAGRTEWTTHLILDHDSVCRPAVCELSNGDLGIIFIDGQYRLYAMVVGLDGTVKTGAALINDYATWVSAPSVERLADGSYLVAYAYLNTTYSISTRTSSDFFSWSAVTSVTPSGLDSANRIDNPDIKQLAGGQIMMVFDYVESSQGDLELVNCYYMTSDDGAGTWTVPVDITGYATFDTVGEDPVIAERAAGDLEIGFVESKPILYMNPTTPGWTGQAEVPNMHYDPATNKLIFCHVNTDMGTKFIDAVTVVDVATWTIEKNYTTSTDPAINQMFRDGHFWYRQDLGEGKYLCGAIGNHIIVIDTEGNDITYRNLVNNDQYGLQENVIGLTWDPYNFRTDDGFLYTQVDAVNHRLYVMALFGYLHESTFRIGYFDLTEQPDPVTGNYTYYPVVSAAYIGGDGGAAPRQFRVVPEVNMILVPFDLRFNDRSTFRIYAIDQENTILYEFNSVDNTGFHRNGIYGPVYHSNGHVYGGTVYESGYDQQDRYGLMDINLSTGAIRYLRPSWGTYDNYNLGQKRVLDDGRVLMTCGYGITIFDPVTEAWALFNNDAVPGLNTIGTGWGSIDYDPVTKTIFTSTDTDGSISGIAAFPEAGKFRQLKYLTGQYDSAWSFGAASALTNTQQEQMPALAVDESDALWAVWDHFGIDEDTLNWASEIADRDLTEYLENKAVATSWEVGSIATLSFTLSHGHLFDPANTMSALAIFLKKGRRIECKMGETVEGTAYLQPQGEFVVRETSISYQRGTYPVITVSCEDKSSLWAEARILATRYFDGAAPNVMIETLLEDHAGLAAVDMNIPIIDNSHDLYHQFIDQDLRDVLDIILGHFGYYFYLGMDGRATAQKIDLARAVDNSYAGEIINFTPDDAFSTFTNRVVATGEGRYDLEVLYDMESVGNLAGTVLPFGGSETKRVWYSEDHVRTCRDPYLEVNKSIREYELFLAKGGGNEFISKIDTDEHYVDVTMEAPDLTGVFVALAASIVATGTAALMCKLNCGGYIFALSIETQLLGYALGAVAQYDYEIHARPVGHEKQTFQAEANDYALQRELDGLVVSEEIEDPFCYEVTHCQRVANHEMAVVEAQRRRVKFSKTTHLQDEIGDVIQVSHPYTGQAINVFVVKLARTWQKGKGVTDQIEGWRI